MKILQNKYVMIGLAALTALVIHANAPDGLKEVLWPSNP